ncbi:nicotinate-nucleotide adenylyltransferase [[Mycoplasma] falconis]|uniref:Probable nicotinate-nucleotide adenylyltransferase n=1 Tax=[Mycoplasma] falconis TaxID=92403 RepID=A0A501X967_9BACT|nr:nicotinate-nucleotide adenylyltransferase [[Mycoplasma] falconis]TPE57070.1 nicotinate-nucleotide adenylyltransferase [[Mycoplasma] falconis]
MKIAIFGGSFNPIHKGHIKVALDAVNELNLDKLYFVPANANPFKKDMKYVENKHRIQMIRDVIQSYDKLDISEFETNRGGVSYTIDTVKYFKHKFPNDEIYLLIGLDNVNKLNKWKNIEEISKLVQITIFNRKANFSKINIKKFSCIRLHNPNYDYSSTKYRKGDLSQVEKVTQEYIGENFLYFEEIARNNLSIERFKHLKFTAEFAALLAKNNNYSIKDAYQAGYMHDITKEWDQEKAYKFLSRYGFNKENLPAYKLHQTTAYYWLKNNYLYPKQEVLEAIKIHTSMSLDMNELDKILFIADKICEGRKWTGVQKLRSLALENLDEGLKAVVKSCVFDLNERKGVTFTPDQLEIYKKWLN